jgi:hypothetical protein
MRKSEDFQQNLLVRSEAVDRDGERPPDQTR